MKIKLILLAAALSLPGCSAYKETGETTARSRELREEHLQEAGLKTEMIRGKLARSEIRVTLLPPDSIGEQAISSVTCSYTDFVLDDSIRTVFTGESSLISGKQEEHNEKKERNPDNNNYAGLILLAVLVPAAVILFIRKAR